MTLDPTEEVFDAVATAIQPAEERACAAAIFPARDARAPVEVADAFAQSVGVKTFIGHKRAAAQQAGVFVHRAQIVARASVDTERDGAAVAIDDREELGVEPALGSPDGLRRLPAGRI